jgi:PAS domain S-box-containing protein
MSILLYNYYYVSNNLAKGFLMTTNTSSTSSPFEPQTIPGISSVGSASLELVNVFQKIVENAGALLDVTNCSVALLDTKTSMLVTLATLHKTGNVQRNTRFQMNEGVAGWVAEHCESLIIDDVSLDPRFKKLGRAPVGSMACVPLIDNGIFIGTLTVSSPERDTFDARKQRMLAIFADQAVLDITNARQADVALRQANQLEMLLRLSQGITTSREVDELYRAILVHVQRLVPSDRAEIYIYNELAQELQPIAEALATSDDGHSDERRQREFPRIKIVGALGEAIRLHHSTSLVAWAATHHHPMIHTPVKFQQDESCVPSDDSKLAEMAVPLVSKEALYGVLLLQRTEAYISEELRLIRNLSDMAAAALENIALFQQVRADQEQWRAIWNTSSDGIALLGSDACFIEANPAFGRMVEQKPQQITGVDFLELFSCSDEGISAECQELSHIQAALQEQRALPYIELDLPIKGAERSIGLSITPVSLTSAPFSLMIARDITSIRDATRVKANFISMITHELRAPINTINGYLDLALTGIGGELNDQQREFVQRARSGSEHLYALVEDLLLVSRADAGQLRLNRAALQLDEVVANSVEELELTAKDSDITIEINISDDLPRLYADSVRLQQVLRNLLSNAIHYTPAGGHVTISARAITPPSEHDEHTNELSGDQSQQFITIEVADTGSGIAPEFHERIFERFFQVPMDISGRTGGQGLGLAIVKMIVELHGGHVSLRSIPGAGSVFTFTLPVASIQLPLTRR